MASARSPGLTTSALALAMLWPRKALLAELDPDGGTIGSARAAAPDPGLQTLAATGRHYLSPGLVTSNVQALPNGLSVLMSPASPDRCAAALAALSPVGLGQTLRSIAGYDVIADCGRIDSRSLALPVVEAADAVLFVVRPGLVDIVGLRSRLETLELRSDVRAGIVVVKQGPHQVEDVAAAFAIPVVGALEWDPRAASALHEGRRVLGRSKLMQSAESLAAKLASQLVTKEAPAPPEPSTAPDAAYASAQDWGENPSSRPTRAEGSVPSPAWTEPRHSISERNADRSEASL
jgi:hypothetical protein